MIHPIQEVTKEFLNRIKAETRTYLINKAIRDHKGTEPKDWVVRELVLGDSSVTDFRDLDYKTSATTGYPQYMIDANDLTADDLSSILAAGETVNDGAYIGIYGVYDLGNEGGEVTGAADAPPAHGSLVSLQFERGGSTLDFWEVEHLYGYPIMMGISDRPVIFEQKEKVDIKMCFTEATEDKAVGLRGYVVEPYGRNIAPDYSGAGAGIGSPMVGGVEPIQELTLSKIKAIRDYVVERLYQLTVDHGISRDLDAAHEEMVVREVVVGDESDATDFVDLDFATAAVTGQQNWLIDSADLTAGDLSNVLVSGETVPDQKIIGVYGFFDRSPNPNVIGLAGASGSGRVDFWQPEHCYAYPNVAGLTERPMFFVQNNQIKLEVNAKAARDIPLGFRALIIERWGDVISQR